MSDDNTAAQIRLLLIEDDPDSGEALKVMLERRDVDVTLVPGAGEAFSEFDPEQFDIVVSDIRLIGRSGVDVLRHVRQDLPNFPVILLTGYDSLESAIEAVRLGAQDYIFKPLDTIEDLLSPVQKAVRDHRLLMKNRALENEIKEKNAELQQALDELKRTQKELVHHERLSALGSMAAKVCHEFNNLMMPIVAYSDALIADNVLTDDDEALSMMKDIKSAALDARQIVGQLRAFYTPPGENGYRNIDVGEMVRLAVVFTKSKWHDESRAGEIEVRTEFGDVPPVHGDDTELRQVFANLILNSAHAMPNGGTITVRSRTEDGAVAVEVEDEGTGMSEYDRKRCLEPFYTTKGKYGTGLGLSVVHGIIKRHSGTIDIQSEQGKGTTAIVRLPSCQA